MTKLSSLSILYLSTLAILIIALGFLREFLFININYHLQFLYYHMKRSYMTKSLNFLRSYTYDELYEIKWILTILFTLVYLFFTCLVIKLLFHVKKCVLRTIYIFAAIVFISFIFYTSGHLVNQDAIGYRLARICMGVVQSPLPLIILIPAFKLIKS